MIGCTLAQWTHNVSTNKETQLQLKLYVALTIGYSCNIRFDIGNVKDK